LIKLWGVFDANTTVMQRFLKLVAGRTRSVVVGSPMFKQSDVCFPAGPVKSLGVFHGTLKIIRGRPA